MIFNNLKAFVPVAARLALPEMQSMIKMKSLIDSGAPVGSITIRDFDDDLKARLRVQAARHGRSMEEEARDLLRCALSTGSRGSLVKSIRRRMEQLGGVELDIPARDEPMRDPPDFG